ncbi:MAG TPA: hypothetical protein P5550_02130 [Bacteroidales bacterium]|nr:hypothetical protein [Bacteroidales bacterium]HRZ77649.1 hypothetical protein [Bacteroidales bacterium]
MSEIFIPLGAFAMIVAIVYLNIRKKERLALLQFNKDASVFGQRSCINPSLKYGLLLMFLGAGLLVANFLSHQGYMDEEPAYFSLLSLASGIALLLYYFLERRARSPKPGPEDHNL